MLGCRLCYHLEFEHFDFPKNKLFYLYIQVYFIEQDIELFSVEHNEGVSCRALNITEELGNIQHIFCDKTGTLTENSMVFRCASIAGVNYPHLQQAKNILMTSDEQVHSPPTQSVIVESSCNEEFEAHRPPKKHHRKVTASNVDKIVEEANRIGWEMRILPL